MRRLIPIVVVFCVLSALFGALEAWWPSIRGQRRIRAGYWTDVGYWVFTPTLTRGIVKVASVIIVVAAAAALKVPLNKEALRAFAVGRHTWVSALPKGVQVFLTLFVGDFFAYWLHRLFHGRTLWKFHAVHHGSVELDWLSSVRAHPVNEVVTRVAQVLLLLLLGFPLDVLAAYTPLLTLYGVALHANVSWDFGPLRAVLASPRFHRWHHTSQEEGLDKNFAGAFPVWDLLFGTYYMPRGRMPERFGVFGEPVPGTFWAQMAYPFQRTTGISGA